MSNVIKSHTVFSSTGEAGTLSVRLDIKTLAIDYEADTRDYEVSVIACSDAAASQATLEGAASNFTIFGVYTAFSVPSFIPSGETLLKAITVSGVKESEYATKSVFYLRLNFVCPTLGVSATARVSMNVSLWKLYTTPELGVAKIDFTLGGDIELVGEFLEVGYDTYCELSIMGNPTGAYPLTAEKRSIPTYREWIEGYPQSRSIPAEISVWAYFDGELLPEPLTLSVNLVLDEADGVPDMQISVEYSSSNEAVSALGAPVKGRSKVHIRPINMTATYGAGIEKSTVALDGVAYDEYCEEELTLAGTHRYTVTVYDTRGFSKSESGTFEVLDYSPPTLSADAIRVDELGNADKKGEYISLLASASGTYPFDGSNEYSFFYTVSIQGREESQTEISFAPDARILVYAGLDISNTYEVRVICRDTFGSSVSRKFLLESERIELNIAKNKVAVGKYASEEKLFDVAWPIRCVGDVRVVDASGNESSLLDASSPQITLHNVSELSEFIDLVSPSEGSTYLRLMNITDSSVGYSEGLHVFLVYNLNGSGGHIELAPI